uniref:Protein phosphatase 1, regulatory (inhibitor) subunit 14Ba n=1 Tax=Hucho hucho TaxID=62062 RepID=A0A4W5JT25_9TELE
VGCCLYRIITVLYPLVDSQIFHFTRLSSLSPLFQEEAIPELEIDVDELLDMPSDDDRGARVKDLLIDCYKPTEDFVSDLLDKIRGMQKLTTPQKK